MEQRKRKWVSADPVSYTHLPYTPDFVKLAESYGAQGIRVTRPEEIDAAFEKAKEKTDGPTLIEFIIDSEQLVFPMKMCIRDRL